MGDQTFKLTIRKNSKKKVLEIMASLNPFLSEEKKRATFYRQVKSVGRLLRDAGFLIM